jgi:pSer/pThr/pTyr-binding forkhead associated (FHA) protein
LGRGPGADIQLDDEHVAERHAELRHCPFGQWWIHDYGNAAGTLVNGERVRSRILSPDDTIAIGRFDIQVRPISSAATGESEIPPAIRQRTESLDDDADRISVVEPRSEDGCVDAVEPVGALQLTAAMQLSRHLMRLKSARDRREALCAFLVGPLHATRACVVRLRGDETAVVLWGSPSAAEGPSHRLSQTLLNALWQRRELVAATTTVRAHDDRFHVVLACPLRDHGQRVDAVYVELSSEHNTDAWRALLVMVARAYQHAELWWTTSNARPAAAAVEQELQTARSLQQRLIVKADGYPEGLELVTEYQPCLWVGGDYMDAITLPDGRALLVIADVCGKGMQGAMVASSLHTLVRATIEGGEELLMLIGRMNRYLSRHLPDDSYVTLVAVVLDPHTGALECINAGHPPAIICGQDGTLRRLQCGKNLALGMWETTTFERQIDRLEDDEILILYTDGLSEGVDEQRDPTAWALWQGVSQFVQHDARDPLTGLADELRRMLRQARGAKLATDDAAFILARTSRLAS